VKRFEFRVIRAIDINAFEGLLNSFGKDGWMISDMRIDPPNSRGQQICTALATREIAWKIKE
jgi:hypothetical protein